MDMLQAEGHSGGASEHMRRQTGILAQDRNAVSRHGYLNRPKIKLRTGPRGAGGVSKESVGAQREVP